MVHIFLTLSCLKKQSIFSSRKTLLQETRFWKTLGIFLRATRLPSLGSVTDLKRKKERKRKIHMRNHPSIQRTIQSETHYSDFVVIMSKNTIYLSVHQLPTTKKNKDLHYHPK